MEYIIGTSLPRRLQEEALRMFVHRFTGEHVPGWALQKTYGGNTGSGEAGHYPVQFRDDADWLAHTQFAVTKAGTLGKRADCRSAPTWPQTKAWRDAPFRRGEI